jgi:hypothetical protein
LLSKVFDPLGEPEIIGGEDAPLAGSHLDQNYYASQRTLLKNDYNRLLIDYLLSLLLATPCAAAH